MALITFALTFAGGTISIMNNKMIFIGCALPLLLSLPCNADESHHTSTKPADEGVVQIKTDYKLGIESEPQGVLKLLSEAIQQDVKSSKFRISWSTSMAEEDLRGTALYNRKDKSIKTYTYYATSIGTGSNSHLYTNVTDEAIAKTVELIYKDKETPGTGGNMYFDGLTLFGCKHRQIK